MISLPPELHPILEQLHAHQIIPIIVGGYVRDAVLNIHSKDIDIELYHMRSLEEIEEILKPFGKLNLVGKSFGVIKLHTKELEIDFSPPRLESKQSAGHKGFEVCYSSALDFDTAARRRDFTINAIGYNPQTKTLLDPYRGCDDLSAKRLRCVDEKTFIEDPLRPLRAIQFAARFDLTCDPKLLSLSQKMISQGALEELPKERIFEELKKLFLLSPKPSIGMKLLREMGGLSFFSPLDQLENTPQDPLTHPEGNVWDHTLMALDVMASLRTGDSKHDLTRMFAVLLHDCAKPITTIIENGKINAPHHAQVGGEIAKVFMEKITDEHALRDDILPLVCYHGKVRKLYENAASTPDILHLSTQVTIEELILVAQADFLGRGFDGVPPEHFEAGEWLYSRAKSLGVLHVPPKPLVMGRDLIALGLIPSENFKTILENAYEAQLNQQFFTTQEAIQWIKKELVIAL